MAPACPAWGRERESCSDLCLPERSKLGTWQNLAFLAQISSVGPCPWEGQLSCPSGQGKRLEEFQTVVTWTLTGGWWLEVLPGSRQSHLCVLSSPHWV